MINENKKILSVLKQGKNNFFLSRNKKYNATGKQQYFKR